MESFIAFWVVLTSFYRGCVPRYLQVFRGDSKVFGQFIEVLDALGGGGKEREKAGLFGGRSFAFSVTLALFEVFTSRFGDF